MPTPQHFEHEPMTTVRCPRCGVETDMPVVAHETVALVYAAECTSPIPSGGRCSTNLRLTVTAHVFPSAPS